MVAVVTLPRVLARMSKWRKQVIKCEKFYHFAMGTGCNLPLKVTVLTFLVKNCKMKLSGESIIKEYAKKLPSQIWYSFSSLSLTLKVSIKSVVISHVYGW